jgi:predicted membrane protein
MSSFFWLIFFTVVFILLSIGIYFVVVQKYYWIHKKDRKNKSKK